MNKLFFVLLLISSSIKSQQWQQITNFPSTERDDGVVFVINNIAYCGTGLTPWWAPLGDFFAFDMSSETWSTIESLPTGEERQYACSFSLQEKGYVFGGINNSGFLNDIWEYNSVSDVWLPKSPLPSTGRSGSSYFVIDSTAYIIGGKTTTDSILNEVWAYDMINDSWQQKNNFPFGGRWRASATTLNNKGYLIFGINENGNYSNQLYEYDATIDSWIIIDTFPNVGRAYSNLITLDSQLILIAGIDSMGASYNSMWSYDVTLSDWNELDSIPANGRKGGLCFNSSYTMYYTTGIDGNDNRLKETWKLFSPTSVNSGSSFSSESILYPNPGNGIINFVLASQLRDREFGLKIYNYQGKLVYEKTIYKHDSPVNLTILENGFYLINLIFENENLELKWIKN